MQRVGYVYILTNSRHSVLYIGVTSNLITRIHQHQTKVFSSSFTAKYNCDKLIYWEGFHSIEEAITREKQLKKWNRAWKENLINTVNSDWKDLSDELI